MEPNCQSNDRLNLDSPSRRSVQNGQRADKSKSEAHQTNCK